MLSPVRQSPTGIGCDTSADSGTDWPYADPMIQEFGFNPDTGHVYDPSSTYDYMSYCYGGSIASWISPFHWKQQFGVEGASVDVAQPQAGANSNVLGVTATLDNPDLDGDTGGALGTLYKTDGGGNLGTPPPGAGYSVQLRNGDQVLATQPFGVSFVPIETDGTTDTAQPSAALPSVPVEFTTQWVDGATSVVLLRGSQVLDTVNVSGHAPTVQVTAPAQHESWAAGSTHTINWTGSDADSDPLTYTVFFSHDGQTWEVLASDIAGASYDVDVDSVAGGDNTMFRVVASDGVNTGYGDSATVSIPNKAPFVGITGPQDGTVVQAGGLVVLGGAATDLEDGPFTDGSLTWSSDKDGLLGTGESLPVNTLSAGQHTITLTATDSNSASASQSITVIVGVPATLTVRPNSIDPARTDDVTAIVTLPPDVPTTEINVSSLHLHLGNAVLTPKASSQLGDTDLDGLPELELTFDGQTFRGAIPAPLTQTLADLTGQMNDGSALEGGDEVALIAPGDVNCSGSTDSMDVLLALRYSTSLGAPACLYAGDMNCSGDVTAEDVLGILGRIGGVSISAVSCVTSGAAPSAAGPFFAPASAAAAPATSTFPDVAKEALAGAALVLPALVLVRRRRK
jgi:hypothetical protein